jgi:hypothetical protein
MLTTASCHKSETLKQAPCIETDKISRILSGEILSGEVVDAQDDEGLAFVYNDAKVLLVLQKITSEHLISFDGKIENATIIHSQYGIVLRNNDTGQIWLYNMNDNISREKFSEVRDLLGGEIQTTEIAGTVSIRINFS